MFNPYSQLNSNVLSILESESLAQKALESWLKETSNLKVFYKNQHNSFSNLHGYSYVTMRNVAAWCGEAKPNLYGRLYRNYEVFQQHGTICLDEGLTGRVEAALGVGLTNYAMMTRSLYLFSPCSVVLFLLTSKSTKADSFRAHINDWSPDKRYSMAKLALTLQQKETTNVKATV